MSIEMSGDQERKLNENGLAFFGAITASVSHELNNVISIIDQSAGLLEDLLSNAGQGNPISNERLEKISERVGQQTRRGIEIIKRLNTFSHSVDDQKCEFELNELVENLTALICRLATLKKVTLEVVYSDEPIALTGNPFLVQQAMFLSFRQVLAAAAAGDTVTITAAAGESAARLVIAGKNSGSGEGLDLSYLAILMNRIGGRIETQLDDDQVVFELTIRPGGP
ncbi:MAG: HAMP domain-containing histidine kinase [Candidatus Zixiibacteriota bacterium]|nr:MAG: HAMP domain-containing histidine kinase [candidate division Zixibacteria bacterium]